MAPNGSKCGGYTWFRRGGSRGEGEAHTERRRPGGARRGLSDGPGFDSGDTCGRRCRVRREQKLGRSAVGRSCVRAPEALVMKPVATSVPAR